MKIDEVKNKLLQGFIKQKKEIVFMSDVTANRLNEIIQDVLDENPSVFYIHEWECEIYTNRVCVKPQYIYKQKEAKEIKAKCNEQCRIILSRIENMSQIEAIKRLHDILVNNIKYEKNDNIDVHTLVGPLLYKKAVCDGFSKLFKYLLDSIGIENKIICGFGFLNTFDNSEKHMWNMLKINGKWYHVDVTYDATLSVEGFIRYDYFLIDDELIKIDHYYVPFIMCAAYDKSFYCYENSQCDVKNKNELVDYIKRQIRAEKKSFIVKMPNSFSYDVVERIIRKYVEEVMISENVVNQHISLYINVSRNIVFVKIG